MQSLPSPIDKEKELAFAVSQHQLALGSDDDRFDLRWYLYRLDQLTLISVETGKLPAAVAATRTMMEAVGIVGTAQMNVDARTQILQLPEGLTTEQLVELATMALPSEPSVNE